MIRFCQQAFVLSPNCVLLVPSCEQSICWTGLYEIRPPHLLRSTCSWMAALKGLDWLLGRGAHKSPSLQAAGAMRLRSCWTLKSSLSFGHVSSALIQLQVKLLKIVGKSKVVVLGPFSGHCFQQHCATPRLTETWSQSPCPTKRFRQEIPSSARLHINLW